ncbi:MAG: hypothetical protein RLZZ238_409, partial [Planctomycetota bacterium]
TCGCGVPDTDTDGDGVADCDDLCPTDPDKTDPGTCGCGVPDTDTDGDGVADCDDLCPTDPDKIDPGTCGCGVPDTDTDGDGVADCDDLCPTDPDKTDPGSCGCGVPDTDSDSDGVADCVDDCPSDPTNQCDLIFEVPGEYATIQAAIDAAPSDRASVVQVAVGTFNESFELLGKDVVVRGSATGDTILSGEGLTQSIARFSGGEPATAGLEDLVFRLGTVGSRITPTSTFTVGGAVYGVNSAARIHRCGFESCRADFGGGVYLLRCDFEIVDCAFTGNTAVQEGGAMQLYECSGAVVRGTFNSNQSGPVGPGSGSAFKAVGARSSGEEILLDSCLVTACFAGVSGSAIEFVERNQPTSPSGVIRIRGCSIQDNTTNSGAAGLRVIGTLQSCYLEDGTLICANDPFNLSGPFLSDGTAGVCDCLADLTGDGIVNGADLSIVLSSWGPAGPTGTGDVTHNGTVDAADLAVLLSSWGICVPE